jgi:2-oxoglutarate dehydrogenase E2 component (dihydrolipoamide succinyltransferase)
MPQFGETVTEGTVARWVKCVGDTVTSDTPIVEIATDKVETEIPAQAEGRIAKICVSEGEVAQVGATLAVIEQQPSHR